MLGSIWFLYNRYTPYPNLYPDQSPSEDWTMEERFRPLTFHGLILRSQLVTLLVRGVCYSENQSVSLSGLRWDSGRHRVVGARGTEVDLWESVCRRAAVPCLCSQPRGHLGRGRRLSGDTRWGAPPGPLTTAALVACRLLIDFEFF